MGSWGAYTPAKTKAFECLVGFYAKQQMRGIPPIEEAVSVEVVAYMPIPSSFGKKKAEDAAQGLVKHINKPDGDNLLKSALDALNGIVFRDDAQACRMAIQKAYSREPRMEITVEVLA